MSKLEEQAVRRLKRGSIERALLSALALTGITFMALAAPNTLKLLKNVDPEWLLKGDPRRRVQQVSRRLRQKGLVEFKREGRNVYMRITPKGKRTLEHAVLFEGGVQKPKRWDGMWRIVIFDIPEKQRQLRVRVREMVSGFGFIRLQDSVWVYPYDCEELIALLKRDLKTGPDLLYIIASAIENDQALCKHFHLTPP